VRADRFLRETTGIFRREGIESPRLDAELILARVLRQGRFHAYLDPFRYLKRRELELMRTLVKERARRVPLAYLLKEKEFMGLSFYVTKGTFIPRPETEIMVEALIATLKREFLLKKEGIKPVIVDVGTGCGNIALSLARFIKGARIYATDISRKALNTARRNLKRYGSNTVTLCHGDLLNPLPERVKGMVDFIVANLPYIRDDEFSFLGPELQYEPVVSLKGGPDGLNLYRRLLPQAHLYLRRGGYLFIEISPEQKESIIDIFARKFIIINIIRDYQGLERVVVLQRR